MRYSGFIVFLIVLFISCSTEKKVDYLSSEKMRMASPILSADKLFFTDSVSVSMNFALPNSVIKYTLDNSKVTDQSKTYNTPILLTETTTISAKNYHPQFQSGNTTNLKVIKTNSKLTGSTISVNPSPNEKYQGSGASSFNDHKKGTASFSSGNSWLGFQNDSIRINIDLSHLQSIKKVLLSTMVNHGAWIFLPKEITVLSKGKIVGAIIVQPPLENDTSGLEFIEIPIKEGNYDHLKIIVSSLDEIPEWHQGKGTTPWFFTDEILVE